MFERFTEKARRVVFFARYEASTFGSSYIEVEHMLLGLLRESTLVRELLPHGAGEALRKRLPVFGEKSSTSVDIPLTMDAKRMLALGAEEAELFDQKHIDCGHLFAGLLKCKPSLAHAFLTEQCGDLEQLLQKVRERLKQYLADAPPQPVRKGFAFQSWIPAPEYLALHGRLSGLLLHTAENLDCYTEAVGTAKLHRLPWTRKQAIGHLLNWTDQYCLWLAECVTEPLLRASHFPSDDWVAVQRYEQLSWEFLVESWLRAGHLVLHAIAALPGAKVSLPCRIGLDEPVTLDKLIERYVDLTEDILEQVLAKL